MNTRASAYALAVNDGKVLLTQLAGFCTNPGHWSLPGGGIDHGEQPHEAVRREVWEESGLRTGELSLLTARTYSEDGRRGPFLGVQIIYQAKLSGAPRVVEVGGSTAAVAWVPLEDLADLPVLPLVRAALDASARRPDRQTDTPSA